MLAAAGLLVLNEGAGELTGTACLTQVRRTAARARRGHESLTSHDTGAQGPILPTPYFEWGQIMGTA